MEYTYPCGCVFDIFTCSEEDEIYSFQVKDDGYSFEPCEEHKNKLIVDYRKMWISGNIK